MNPLNSLAILLAAFLAVYLEAAFSGLRNFLGAQIDLLPALMVYASLYSDLVTLTLLAVLGGLWFDALSANPLGISVLPLFAIGFLIFGGRDLVLREQPYAQFAFGLAASATAPLLTLLLLFGAGENPLVGWRSLWQWVVMALGGAVVTPAFTVLFNGFHRAFSYQRPGQSSFRPDREIKRGRR